jgi:hypothetical protein
MFSDTWFGNLAMEIKNNYSILAGLAIGFSWRVFKTIAIRHPGVLDNKVWTLWKSWMIGLPLIGPALKKEEPKKKAE